MVVLKCLVSFLVSLVPKKVVICGGSMNRMGVFAELLAKEIGHPQVTKEELSISKTDRFAFYKIGSVLSVSVSPDISVCDRDVLVIIRANKYSVLCMS